MSTAVAGVVFVAVLCAALALAYGPLGDYMYRVYTAERHWRVERGLYRVMGVNPDAEQRWGTYLRSVLAFSLVGVLFLYAFLRLQNHLLLSPGFPAVEQPDMDGVEVIGGLRGWTSVPIIVLSGRTDSDDKVDALDAGADDYVTKPFAVDELLARVRAVSRRVVNDDDGPEVALGDHVIDLAARRVIRGGAGEVRLTPTEWHVLEILLRHPGKLISQRQLLTQVWVPAYADEFHYLREYLARLRRKLEPDPARPRYLLTEPGMGYRYQP